MGVAVRQSSHRAMNHGPKGSASVGHCFGNGEKARAAGLVRGEGDADDHANVAFFVSLPARFSRPAHPMDTWLVAAALVSAALHAAWNAGIKSSQNSTEAMTGQMVGAALIGVPILFWAGLPHWQAVPWIAIATALNLVAILALLRAYDMAGFGLAYPISRATAVTVATPLAVVVAGERLSVYGIAGVGLMAAALVTIALSSRGSTNALTKEALGWILVSGAIVAVVVLCEAQGVRVSGSALAYGAISAITNAFAMCWKQGQLTRPFAMLAKHWTVSVPAACAAMTSYLIILYVFTRAPVAVAQALRDTSAIFAILIAIFWLKEPFTAQRLVAVALAALAIPLLRFA
jgi:drug/metabolite transporter (DMT)-like permease